MSANISPQRWLLLQLASVILIIVLPNIAVGGGRKGEEDIPAASTVSTTNSNCTFSSSKQSDGEHTSPPPRQWTSVDEARTRFPGCCAPGLFDCIAAAVVNATQQCVPLQQVHDGVPDCADGSDEACFPGQIRCGGYCADSQHLLECLIHDPQCGPPTTKNDDVSTLEPPPRSVATPPTTTPGGNRSQAVASFCPLLLRRHLCGRPHTISCRGYGECILAKWLADGKVDCFDGSDEDPAYADLFKSSLQHPPPPLVVGNGGTDDGMEKVGGRGGNANRTSTTSLSKLLSSQKLSTLPSTTNNSSSDGQATVLSFGREKEVHNITPGDVSSSMPPLRKHSKNKGPRPPLDEFDEEPFTSFPLSLNSPSEKKATTPRQLTPLHNKINSIVLTAPQLNSHMSTHSPNPKPPVESHEGGKSAIKTDGSTWVPPAIEALPHPTNGVAKATLPGDASWQVGSPTPPTQPLSNPATVSNSALEPTFPSLTTAQPAKKHEEEEKQIKGGSAGRLLLLDTFYPVEEESQRDVGDGQRMQTRMGVAEKAGVKGQTPDKILLNTKLETSNFSSTPHRLVGVAKEKGEFVSAAGSPTLVKLMGNPDRAIHQQANSATSEWKEDGSAIGGETFDPSNSRYLSAAIENGNGGGGGGGGGEFSKSDSIHAHAYSLGELPWGLPPGPHQRFRPPFTQQSTPKYPFQQEGEGEGENEGAGRQFPPNSNILPHRTTPIYHPAKGDEKGGAVGEKMRPTPSTPSPASGAWGRIFRPVPSPQGTISKENPLGTKPEELKPTFTTRVKPAFAATEAASKAASAVTKAGLAGGGGETVSTKRGSIAIEGVGALGGVPVVLTTAAIPAQRPTPTEVTTTTTRGPTRGAISQSIPGVAAPLPTGRSNFLPTTTTPKPSEPVTPASFLPQAALAKFGQSMFPHCHPHIHGVCWLVWLLLAALLLCCILTPICACLCCRSCSTAAGRQRQRATRIRRLAGRWKAAAMTQAMGKRATTPSDEGGLVEEQRSPSPLAGRKMPKTLMPAAGSPATTRLQVPGSVPQAAHLITATTAMGPKEGEFSSPTTKQPEIKTITTTATTPAQDPWSSTTVIPPGPASPVPPTSAVDTSIRWSVPPVVVIERPSTQATTTTMSAESTTNRTSTVTPTMWELYQKMGNEYVHPEEKNGTDRLSSSSHSSLSSLIDLHEEEELRRLGLLPEEEAEEHEEEGSNTSNILVVHEDDGEDTLQLGADQLSLSSSTSYSPGSKARKSLRRFSRQLALARRLTGGKPTTGVAATVQGEEGTMSGESGSATAVAGSPASRSRRGQLRRTLSTVSMFAKLSGGYPTASQSPQSTRPPSHSGSIKSLRSVKASGGPFPGETHLKEEDEEEAEGSEEEGEEDESTEEEGESAGEALGKSSARPEEPILERKTSDGGVAAMDVANGVLAEGSSVNEQKPLHTLTTMKVQAGRLHRRASQRLAEVQSTYIYPASSLVRPPWTRTRPPWNRSTRLPEIVITDSYSHYTPPSATTTAAAAAAADEQGPASKVLGKGEEGEKAGGRGKPSIPRREGRQATTSVVVDTDRFERLPPILNKPPLPPEAKLSPSQGRRADGTALILGKRGNYYYYRPAKHIRQLADNKFASSLRLARLPSISEGSDESRSEVPPVAPRGERPTTVAALLDFIPADVDLDLPGPFMVPASREDLAMKWALHRHRSELERRRSRSENLRSYRRAQSARAESTSTTTTTAAASCPAAAAATDLSLSPRSARREALVHSGCISPECRPGWDTSPLREKELEEIPLDWNIGEGGSGGSGAAYTPCSCSPPISRERSWAVGGHLATGGRRHFCEEEVIRRSRSSCDLRSRK